MATQQYFGGKLRKLPGAYSKITSGEKNSPANLDFGKVLVIDTGLGATYGGGSGIKGALNTGKDSIYEFEDSDDYKSFLKGGLLWKLSEKLFNPLAGVNGASKVYHVKAAETAAAVLSFIATGGVGAGGSLKLKCKDEGVIGNGVITGSHLDKGYAYTIEAGISDPAKWVMKIWLGQWKGDHTDSLSYDLVPKAATSALLVAQSPEFNNMADLITWAQTDTKLGNLFVLDETSAVVGTGVVDAADVVTAANPIVATGGTETYDSANLDLVFDSVKDLDFQFILVDKYGVADYNNALVTKILAHLKDAGTTFLKTMFYGGGQNEDEFDSVTGSLAMAEYYNSPRAVVVHGGAKETTELLASGFRIWPSIYTAAVVLGRTCGLQPQIPITNKTISIDGLVHNMKEKEMEKALDKGVLAVIKDQYRGGFKVLQGVNSLQDNKVLFNQLGQSHSIQFERIVSQVNRELIVNSQTDLLNQENGVNINTLSPGILKTWTETYLQNRVASGPEGDNLLSSFRNVTVTKVDDYYNVTYGIVVNNEITKIFYTGYLFK